MSSCEFSSSSCSYFMVPLDRKYFSCSLSNFVSKFLSNLLFAASYESFFSMDCVSVLSLSYFILSVSLKSSAIFNTFWLLVCSSPFFVYLVCSVYFDTIYFSLVIQSSDYCAGQLFPFGVSAKENMNLQLSFCWIYIFFHLSKLCVIFYLDSLQLFYYGGCSVK